MSGLSLSLLGPYTATINNQPLAKLPTVRSQALLIYLAVEAATGTTAQRRETLMELLWPGMPSSSGRKNLRQTIYYLRQTIESVQDDSETEIPFLLADRYTVEINSSYPLALDVSEFLNLLSGPQENWPRAIELYRGDFLVDFFLDDSPGFEEWILARRASLRRRALEALDTLTVQAISSRDYDEARRFAERQIELDGLHERAYRQLIELLARSGFRKEALEQYQVIQQALAEELGMSPSARTRDLYQRILAGEIDLDSPLDQGVRGYELKEQIGEGAFGVVHRAVQPGVNREVAIKIIRQNYADDPKFIRRFENEAQIVGQLEHPYIVPLYDYWRDPEGAYLIMRYMRGGDLLAGIQASPMRAEASLELVEQIASALSIAHRKGIVHRDLKPANILFDQEGNAYLSDFGIATNLDSSFDSTTSDAIIGTLDYSSPEQIKNEPISPQADVYSLGMVMYQTLTGEKPFANASVTDLLYKQLNEPVPLISSTRPDLPRQIDNVIQKATAKQPTERFADVLEMAVAFRQAIRGDERGRVASFSPAVLADSEVSNPYKGLRAFQVADAQDFFGRGALIEQLLGRLEQSRFLAVVGPSGSGKSSVVKAGLVPALLSGAIPGSDKWFVAEMVPGVSPFEELEKALWPVAVDPPPSLVEPMRRDNHGLLNVIRRILPKEEGAELLLVIDQFEELFTLVNDEHQRDYFIDSLLTAVAEPNSPLRVLITLRADFYDRPLQVQPLGHWLKESTEVVLPMSSDELVLAIQEPAARTGVLLEDGLLVTIVADVSDQPGALPLLQYALTELFDRRQDNFMTRSGYEEIGGVLGALGRRAEELYVSLDESEQDAARQIFLRLVTLGEGVEDTRRRVLRSELTALASTVAEASELQGDAPADSQLPIVSRPTTDIAKVLDVFGQARLLTFDRDPVTREPSIEVAHEALLREWDRLRQWLNESRSDIRLQRSLAATAAEWQEANQDDGYLLHGARLSQFEAWQQETGLSLTQSEQALLIASLDARSRREAEEETRYQRELKTAQKLAESERQRAEEQTEGAQRLRRRALFLAGALVLAAILAAVALIAGRQASQNANIAERSADESQSLALASGTQAALADNETDQALALAVAANQIEEPPAFAQQMLYEAALAPGTIQRIDGGGIFRWAMDVHPNGKIVASAADDGSVTLWDVETAAEIIRLEGGHSEPLGDVVFTPDGEALLSGGFDDLLVLWDVQTGEIIRTMLNPSDEEDPYSGDVNSLDIARDGRLAIAGTGSGVATIWDLATGELLGELAGHDPELQIQPAVFSPDGRIAATGSEDTTIILWDVEERSLLHQLEGHDDIVFALAFSPDGKTVASGSFDNNIILWDVESGEPIATLEGHNDFVFDVVFNEDGTQLLSSSRDQSVIRWDVVTAEQLQTYQGEPGRILSVDYIDEERGISTASTGNLRIWSLDNEMVFENYQLTDDLLVSLTQINGLAAAGLNKEIYLMDLKSGETLRQFTMPLEIPESLPLSRGDVTALAFDQGAENLLSGADEGSIVLWDVERGQEVRRYEGHTDRILDLVFSPDGEQFLSASDDKTMILWNMSSGDIIHRFESPTDTINRVAFSPDGRTLAAGFGTFRYLIEGDHQDNNIHLWDTASGEEIRELAGHEGPVTALNFSPDGQTLISGSIDETVRLWEVDSGEQIRRFDGHTGGVFDISFSPDGEYAATGAADATVFLWHVPTGDPLRQLTGHEGVVHHISFEENGDRLWSSAEDGQLKSWNLSLDLDELLVWTQANRYVPEFSCNQRAQYRIEPLCADD